MSKISFLKIRDVKSPDRAHPFDAGIDFFIPKFVPKFIKDLKDKNPSIFYPDNGNSCDAGNGLVFGSASTSVITLGNSDQVSYDLSDDNNTLIKFDEESGENYFLMTPHSKILIPSGIKTRMNGPISKNDNYALIAFNKSGVASKLGLDIGACVIDYTYEGEIHINLINTSTKSVRIYENMKAAQFIEMPIKINEVEVLDQTDEVFYKGRVKDRKDGGFGSTDKKTK